MCMILHGTLIYRKTSMQNHAWQSLESVNVLHEVLKAYDKDYDPNILTRSQLSRMPKLKRLLESNHVQWSEYSFWFRKWKEEDCDICKNIGRGVRTHHGDAWREVLRYMYPPIPNPMDKEHYLSPSSAREHIDRLNLSQIEQRKFLPYLCKKIQMCPQILSVRNQKIEWMQSSFKQRNFVLFPYAITAMRHNAFSTRTE